MKDLLTIACGAGLQDGLNPCIFMTCAVFIVYGFWLSSSPLPIRQLTITFGLIYILSTLNFNFGPGQIFVLQKSFCFAAKIIYFVLGIVAFILGVLSIKEWFLSYRRSTAAKMAGEKTNIPVFLVWLITAVLAAVMSALATTWPVNKYIILLGNEAIIKGQWQTIMPLLVTYVLFSTWPLWFVWALLSIKNLRPALSKIICAAVFFTASSSMILLFK